MSKFVSNWNFAFSQLQRVISGQARGVRSSWVMRCLLCTLLLKKHWIWGHTFVAVGRQSEGEDGGWSGGEVWRQHWPRWRQQQTHWCLGWHPAECRLNCVTWKFAIMLQLTWVLNGGHRLQFLFAVKESAYLTFVVDQSAMWKKFNADLLTHTVFLPYFFHFHTLSSVFLTLDLKVCVIAKLVINLLIVGGEKYLTLKKYLNNFF